MTSISNASGAGVLSENRMVAIISWSAALVLAAVLIALVSAMQIEAPGESSGAPVVNAIISAPPAPAPRTLVREPPPVEAEAIVSSAALMEGDAEWPHLWTYDVQGRVVFRTDEQLARCMRARRDQQEQSDCPDSRDRTPMISSEGRRRYGD